MKKLGFAIAMTVVIAGNAMAADGNFYAGIGYGNTKIKDGVSFSFSNSEGSASLDTKDTGTKLFAGYVLNKNVAIEAFYTDLGKATVQANLSSPKNFPINGTTYSVSAASLKQTAKTFGITGMFTFSVSEKTSAYAKLGLHSWDGKVSGAVTSSPALASLSISESGTDTIYGIGASYKINDKFSARAEYEVYSFDGDLTDGDVEFISVGAQMKF